MKPAWKPWPHRGRHGTTHVNPRPLRIRPMKISPICPALFEAITKRFGFIAAKAPPPRYPRSPAHSGCEHGLSYRPCGVGCPACSRLWWGRRGCLRDRMRSGLSRLRVPRPMILAMGVPLRFSPITKYVTPESVHISLSTAGDSHEFTFPRRRSSRTP